MARLPQPGSDNGTWGNVLNDFLSQSLNPNGTLKENIVSAANIQDGALPRSVLAADTVARAPVLYDPSTKGNGLMPATGTMDTGQSFTAFTNPLHAAAPLTISNGVIAHTPIGSSSSAGYMQADLGARVHRIGCMASWPTNAEGSIAIALPISSWQSTGTFSNAGFHLTVQGHGVWSLIRYSASGSTTLASYTTHGRPQTVWGKGMVPIDIWIDTDNGKAVICWWDGSRSVINSDYFKTETSNYAIWELYVFNSAAYVPATMGLLWASADPVTPDVYPNPIWQKAYSPRSTSTTSGAVSVDFSRATLHEITLNGNVTSLSLINPPTDHETYEVVFIQDATGSRTLSGASGIRWAGAATPTLSTTANRRDFFRFRYSGGVWWEVGRSMNVGV